MELRPCDEGGEYNGTVDLTADEVFELLNLFDDEEEAGWEHVRGGVRILQTRLTHRLDLATLEDIRALYAGPHNRRTLQQARNAFERILRRVTPTRTGGRSIRMSMKQFLAEHDKLLKVLRTGTKAERLAEAKEQEAEVKQQAGGAKKKKMTYERFLDQMPHTYTLKEWRALKRVGVPTAVDPGVTHIRVETYTGKAPPLIEGSPQWVTTYYKDEKVVGKVTTEGAKPTPKKGGRIYPEQFSTPLRTVLATVSFGPPDVMGSSGDSRSLYAADYDLLEYVPLRAKTVKAFQKKVAHLASKYCITDIKCGEVAEQNLLQSKTYDQAKELAHLTRLWREKVISDAELAMGRKLLTKDITPANLVDARKQLRFGVLRWTPKDIAAGFLTSRQDKPIRLEDAMKSSGITKVDVLAWVKDKYVEVSNIILWTGPKGKPYANMPEVLSALKEDIAYYIQEGNYFKAAKRMLSIAKNRKEVATAEALLAILNSPLGHISTVVSDLKTLAEFPNCVTQEKKREQLDALRDDMAKLYFPEFATARNPATLLPALEVKLQKEARKQLEEGGFLPLKGFYKVGKE